MHGSQGLENHFILSCWTGSWQQSTCTTSGQSHLITGSLQECLFIPGNSYSIFQTSHGIRYMAQNSANFHTGNICCAIFFPCIEARVMKAERCDISVSMGEARMCAPEVSQFPINLLLSTPRFHQDNVLAAILVRASVHEILNHQRNFILDVDTSAYNVTCFSKENISKLYTNSLGAVHNLLAQNRQMLNSLAICQLRTWAAPGRL